MKRPNFRKALLVAGVAATMVLASAGSALAFPVTTIGTDISTSGGTITSSGLLTASNGFTLSSGALVLPAASVADAALQSDVTTAGNAFNGASQLVRMTAATKLPVVDGSLLTGLTVGQVAGAAASGANSDITSLTGLTTVLASTYGGTGNGWTKFSGPTTAEKTFTLPDASAAILTDNAAVTVLQGGTGATTASDARTALGLGTAATHASGDFAASGANSDITSLSALTGLGVTGAVTFTANVAATIPLSVVGAASQSGDFLDVTAHGGTAGGILTVNSSGDVGIGTTSPGAKLSVLDGSSVANIGALSGYPGISGIAFTASPAAVTTANYSLLGNGSDTAVNRPTGGNIYFRENNANQVTILTGGNVGIGTASPGTALDVSGVITGQAAKLGASGTTSVLVTDGDSITAAGVYQPLLSLAESFTVTNTAVSGRTLDTMQAASFSSVDPLYSYNARRNIVVIWGGTNNFYFDQDLTSTYDRLLAYCASRKRAGWQVVVVTMLSRTGTGLGGTSLDTYHDQYNALIRAHWPEFADALADVASDPNLGADGAYANATYFADGIHPTAAGHALVAPIISAAVNGLTAGNRYLPEYSTVMNGKSLNGQATDGSLKTILGMDTSDHLILAQNGVDTQVDGGLQVLGGLVSPGGNGGFELEYNGGLAYVTAYDRGGSAWLPMVERASYVAFQNSGAEAMRITGGYVGIGTPTPSSKLDVSGEIDSGESYRGAYTTAIQNRQAYYSFDGSTIDTNQWLASGGGVTQSDALLFASGDAAWDEGVVSKAVFQRSNSLVMEVDVTPASSGDIMVGFHDTGTSFSYVNGHHYLMFVAGGSFRVWEDGSAPFDGGSWTVGTKYRVRVVLKTGGGAAYYVSADGGRTWTTVWAGNTAITSTPVKLGVAYNDGSFTVDNVEVYSADGPAHLYGNMGLISEVSGQVGIGNSSPSSLLSVGTASQFQVDASGNVSTSGTITAGGNLTLGPATSHFISSQTTIPTIGGGSTCGTTAITAGSTDSKGSVTVSCTASQTVVVHFNVAYASNPICVASPANAAAAVTASATPVGFASATTTDLTITTAAATTTAGVWNYICIQ